MDLNVYKADDTHLEVWLPLAKAFYDEGYEEYQWGFNDEHARTTYKLFILNHICFLAELNGEAVGCLAGVVSQHHFNYHHLYFQESMWYVRKDLRGKGIASKLLEATKKECLSRNCNQMIVGHTAKVMSKFLDRFYRQLGFVLFESHYIKDI